MLGWQDVISFWFMECTPEDWFSGEAAFDARVEARFIETYHRVTLGEAFTWRSVAEGRLAEVIVLDQFSRQFYRQSPRAFAYDGMALALAQEAVAGGHDLGLGKSQRQFLYMPYMHSESLAIHDAGLPLFQSLNDPGIAQYEYDHAAVLRRFGRYPRRNAPLGRDSTLEEIAYLAEDGTRAF
ncbi:MAG TPA: DUF924 family protein [Devosiaceae bacterium]|jgi:uncharacterized protein (DUF924 family)